jgi:hypothetical protein
MPLNNAYNICNCKVARVAAYLPHIHRWLFWRCSDVTAGKRATQLLDGRSIGTMKATKITMMLVLAGMAMTAAATGELMAYY